MNAAPVMIWCSGPDGSCNYFNKVWLDFTGRSLDQEILLGWRDGVHPEDYERRASVYAEHFGRREPFRIEYRLLRHDGVWRWLLGTGVPRYTEAGHFEGFIGSCLDIADIKESELERQRALEEKAALLQEIHHRVKNNAQVFASLLTIQANRADDPAVECALRTAASRASALAITQQQIYDSGSSAEFDLGSFVRRLAQARGASFAHVRIDVRTSPGVEVPLPTAVPLALIANELLTNALRHGFPGKRAGHVQLRLEREPNGQLCLEVRDNGVGLAPGVTLETQRSAGLTIVRSLARQLGATLTLEAARGAHICLRAPRKLGG